MGLFHIWLWKFLWKTSVRGAFSELVAIVLEEGEGERDLQREREREKKKEKKKKKKKNHSFCLSFGKKTRFFGLWKTFAVVFTYCHAFSYSLF